MEASRFRNHDGNNYLPPGRIYGSHYRTPGDANYLPPGRIYGVGEFHAGQSKVFTVAFRNSGASLVVLAGMFLCLVDTQHEIVSWSSGIEGSVVTLPAGGEASLSGVMTLPAAGTYSVFLVGTKTIDDATNEFGVAGPQQVTVI